MASLTERPVCGLCRKLYDELLDGDTWHEGPFQDDRRNREYEWICQECHGVVVEGEPDDCNWILREFPVSG